MTDQIDFEESGLGGMGEYFLVVEVMGLERLDRTMGSVVTNSALADLSERISSLAAEVLSLAQSSTPARLLRRGCWSAFFALSGSSPIGGEASESIESISTATQQLANEAALAIFGPASAALASLSVACIERASMHEMDSCVVRPEAMATFDPRSRAAVREIIDGGLLRTVFQPIVTMRDGRAVGVEALSRGPAGSPYERADQLFGAASRGGLSNALELACAVQAMSYMERLPEPLWMSVNASSTAATNLCGLISGDCAACSRLMLEMTEHLPMGKIEDLRPTLEGFRSMGVRIALDDTGCGYADCDAAFSIQADIVKLCITVIGRVEQHRDVRNAITETVRQIHSRGGLVLAEGVETLDQTSMLGEMGIDLAQGWLYGRPFPAAELQAWAQTLAPCEWMPYAKGTPKSVMPLREKAS